MYHSHGIAAVTVATGGGTALAATGMNIAWLLLAAFALLSAGLAVLRTVPRREE